MGIDLFVGIALIIFGVIISAHIQYYKIDNAKIVNGTKKALYIFTSLILPIAYIIVSWIFFPFNKSFVVFIAVFLSIIVLNIVMYLFIKQNKVNSIMLKLVEDVIKVNQDTTKMLKDYIEEIGDISTNSDKNLAINQEKIITIIAKLVQNIESNESNISNIESIISPNHKIESKSKKGTTN